VALLGIVDGDLALTKGVPQTERLVLGSGNDLSVVGGEGDGGDVLGVLDELTGGLS
jgi:hypothetical protein